MYCVCTHAISYRISISDDIIIFTNQYFASISGIPDVDAKYRIVDMNHESIPLYKAQICTLALPVKNIKVINS